MIRQQIRNRARHSRYRRVLTGGRRGLLGKRWNSRDSRKQDRGHCCTMNVLFLAAPKVRLFLNSGLTRKSPEIVSLLISNILLLGGSNL